MRTQPAFHTVGGSLVTDWDYVIVFTCMVLALLVFVVLEDR